jgi:hypothetical protein
MKIFRKKNGPNTTPRDATLLFVLTLGEINVLPLLFGSLNIFLRKFGRLEFDS